MEGHPSNSQMTIMSEEIEPQSMDRLLSLERQSLALEQFTVLQLGP